MNANDAVATPTEAMQRAFARLVTSSQARARFAADPHAEAPELAAMPPQHVDYYARGLVAKRFAEVRRLLPHVARAAGLADRFRAHVDAFAPGGHGRHRSDALAFARTLERAGVRGARIDRLALEASRGGRFAALAFAHGRAHVWLRIAPGAPLYSRSLELAGPQRATRSAKPIS